MKEIKCRAFITDKCQRGYKPNQMWDWAQIASEVQSDFKFAHYFFFNDAECGVVFMQFTGLHDKNGKEIYEGDVVDVPYLAGKGEVKFGDFMVEGSDVYSNFCRTGWYIKFKGDDDQTEDLDIDCEIIGNIYENPELLK